MSSYYNPSKRLSEYAAALLSPYIKLENEGEQRRDHCDQNAAPSLSVGLWSGNVELKNVEIRPEAIEQFLNDRDNSDDNGIDDGDFSTTARIKWKLRRGRVDSVKIQIPWKSLLVGSAYSSTTRESHTEGGKIKAAGRMQGYGVDDEPECVSVCTTIHIEGVTLLLGYEIIHHNPLLNPLQHQRQKNGSTVSSLGGDEQSSDEDHLRLKMRQEKNRILQIAERRLQMGLDPFPPYLMEELHSLIRSSTQSESLLSSSVKKSVPSSNLSQPINNDESLGLLTTNTHDTTSARTTYLARMENYFSSSIKSLLWRVFESLSLSVKHVQLSVVGDSHYDKDHRALLRREITAKAGGKSTDDKKLHHQQQHNSAKKGDNKRDFQHHGIRRLHRNASRAGKEHCEAETVDHNRDSDSQRKALDEDSSIWSRKGLVELGVTLDRLYVRPGPSPARFDGDSQSGSVALKLVHIRRAGVFIRRIHPLFFGDRGAQCDDIKETAAMGHVGRNLFWKDDMNEEDFVVIPTSINASCTVYRDVSESHGVETTSSSSPQTEKQFLLEKYDDASSIGVSLSSKGTETTGRRGKRDKRQKTIDFEISGPLQPYKRPDHTVISSTAPSTDTSGTRRFTQSDSAKDSFPSAFRLEVNTEVGHIQSSLSPRQVFLVHSLSSSIARMKRGRPETTIRDALAQDKVLTERMAEEGQFVMAWEDRIYRELPLLKSHLSRQSMRTLPGVISSWWKYAYLNVVNEIRQQRRVLGRYSDDRANTACSKKCSTLSRPNFESQSKIRREYIDLYMSAYGSNEPVVDNSAASDTRLLLAKLEDELPIERLLLLKNVARAASVRRAQMQDHSSPTKNYYRNFFSDSQSIDTRNWSIKKGQRIDSERNGPSLAQKIDSECVPVPSLQLPEVDASLAAPEKYDARSQTTRNSTATRVRETISRDALYFSGHLTISGFSLALCDFFDGDTEVKTLDSIVDQYRHSYIADDISTLTGFSDDESKTAKQRSIQDTFDPLIQFWPTTRHGFHCKPILLIHVAGILLSTRRRKNDAFQPMQLINDFSVGGISLQMPQHIFFRLGHVPCGSNSSEHSKGVSGRCSSLSSSIVVGPTEIIVDWAWVEEILKFWVKVKDIRPVRVTVKLENEDLLIRSVPTLDRKRIGRHTYEARFAALSLTIPLHNAIADDASEQQYVIAAANRFHVKTINPDPGCIIVPTKESGKKSNLILSSDEDLIFDLDGLDAVIEIHKKKHAEIQKNSIRLLRSPISIQVQCSSGTSARPLLLEQPHHYGCQSYDVRSQNIQLLVSESRLRALLKTVETVRKTLSNITDVAPKHPKAVSRSTKLVMAEYVFAEWKASIQSLGIHVIPDAYYEESLDDLCGRRLLEDAIESFVCHLSYLDIDHPSQVAIDCISMIFIERCRALGITENEARELIHAARANFKSDASATLGGNRAVNHNRNISRCLDAPLALPEALFNQVVNNSTRMTMAKFVGSLSAESKCCDLSLFAESLVLSWSFHFVGSTSQVTVKSLRIQNQQINLLSISHQSGDSDEPPATPDETDPALAMTVRSRNDANRGYGQDILIEAGRVVCIFSPEAYLEASKACSTLFDVVPEAERIHHHERPVGDMIVNGCLSSLTLVLADKCIPFIECRFQDMTFKKSAIESQTSTHTLFHAGAVSIDCVSQTSYPRVLSTYTAEKGDDSAFSIHLNTPSISASSPSELFIELNGVRIVLLRRILNEILQYISSPNYGIGFVLNRFETKTSTPPPELKLSIRNSTIVLPRDSGSVDMVGVEVQEISLAQEQLSETWSIEKYSFSNDTVSQSPDKFVRTSSSADIFFDCIDAHVTSELNFTPPETQIKRYTVQVKGGDVFTALNPWHVSSSDINMSEFAANVRSTGRAAHHKRPFSVCGRVAKTLNEDLVSRVWEKVNEAPVNLRITLDRYMLLLVSSTLDAPMVRILVEDVGDSNSRGAHFAMRMSQFYLVMSIWYSNMKELPILFPYDSDFVEKSSIDPDPPADWPEYGTSEFVSRLKQCGRTFEMALCFKNLTWRCFYDHPDFFAAIPPSMSLMQSVGIEPEGAHGNNFISIAFKNAVCSINNDEENLQRIGVGAASIVIHDGRQQHSEANLVKMLRSEGDLSRPIIVDLNWGLDCGRHTLLADGLPMPFQATIFMTPDGLNCLVNLGVDFAESNLADLTPIWILLDYFSLYFKTSEYGHPAFEAELIYLRNIGDESSELNDNGLNIDFRLWMIKPHVIIPSSSEVYVMFEAAGLYYRYKSFGQNYSSQEVVAKDLGIVVLGEYTSPSMCRGLRQVSGSLSSCGVQTLIEDMSFSLKYDFNAKTNAAMPYFKVALRLPLSPKHFDRPKDGIECSSIDAQPFCVPPPLVCKPFVVPSRVGDQETTIYFSYEYMSLLLDVMTTFVGPRQQISSSNAVSTRNDGLPPENCFSVIAHVERVKCIISDPVMGMHRPFLSICLPSLLLTASQLQIQKGPEIESEKSTGDTDASLHVCMEVTIFIEHFKLGLTRNWEVFLEPFKYLVLYERSASRGKGITFNADCPLHLNISSALIETMDDAIKTYELFRAGSITQQHNLRNVNGMDIRTSSAEDERGRDVTVIHRFAEHLEGSGRVAFSLENCTGELLRVQTRTPHETEISIVYLNHTRLMPLSFPATQTAIKNLENVEVPFKGDQNVSQFRQKLKNVASHEIDFQIPGFRWVRGVSFDKTGKHFLQVIPRSTVIESKIADDWRLKNALHVLAEIMSVNGGRRLSITSPFEVINKTDHPIILATDPDPRHAPALTFNGGSDSADDNGFSVTKINPDETHNISFLLIESALRVKGNHLGSLWIRPDQSSKEDFKDIHLDPHSLGLDESIIAFPFRPIQLAKMVHESSVVFKDSNSDPAIANQVASGIEISCPVYNKSEHIPISRPFCYVVEVKRSPFVRSKSVNTPSPVRIGKGFAKNIFSKNTAPEKADVHGPIAYSLVIHPPLVIENLLPERGRFEIIHAISRNVLWWASLKAGERVSVFTVGLDAPLLLLVNLGYCRTAVGEGALVHHGGGDGLFKPWNAFQGAMKTSRDRVKRTLYTIAESKDKRGAQRIARIKAHQTKMHKDSNGRRANYIGSKENDVVENSADGFLRRGNGFGLEDIATELCVVDSVGQRLTLNIDNVLGSGGQRRVTLFSPFWIVNTTEHSLRYKQEKALSFVAGTVLSKAMDGSKPVDEGHRSHLDIDEDEGLVAASRLDSLNTIFPGRPGAMSMLKSNVSCSAEPALLAALISNDLPLRVLSKLAFMFNFHDVLSLGGPSRFCIQLADTQHDRSRYTSAWSSAFGLESVGVTQIVSMHCKDGRGLEVSVSVSVAPGRLGSFTKIVRICPRYVVVNQLPFPIRLWQDSSILHPNVTREDSSAHVSESQKWFFANSDKNNTINQYERLFGLRTSIDGGKESSMSAQSNAHHDACFIATVCSSELAAFHLPDTRLERSLRVDFGPSWYLSPSFAADIPGEYFLSMSRVRDLGMLSHVSSRGAPVYTITLPPTETNDWNGELGVFFETEWGKDRTLIVKGIREGSYASYFTDIACGDEMIKIDSTLVKNLSFDDAMKLMKSRLYSAKQAAEKRTNSLGTKSLQLQLMVNKTKKRIQRTAYDSESNNDNVVTLTFLTQEERLRRLRRAAVGTTAGTRIAQESRVTVQKIDHAIMPEQGDTSKELLVDMKFLFQSVFVFLRRPISADPPYRIVNRSLHWRIYYRQKACDSHPWQCLSPGESSAYTWEEPLKVKKLSVRVGAGEWIDGEFGRQHPTTATLGQIGKSKGREYEHPIFSFQFFRNEELGYFGGVKTIKLEEIGHNDSLPCPPRCDKGFGTSYIKKENSLSCQVDSEGSTRVLVISDQIIDSNGDETLVRRHLERIRKEISDEEMRRAQVVELRKDVARTYSTAFPADPDVDSQSSSHYKPDAPPCNMTAADAEAIETELQELMNHDEGLSITMRNQIVIEVMEATGLRSSDLNGFSNPFVQVKLICTNKKTHFGSFNATRNTYFVENTLSPQWCYQSFVFDVPEKASYDPKETRRYFLQCVIKSKDTFAGSKFLGRTHVHLRNLKDQREHIGWYKLMGKLGNSGIGKDPLDKICGSIRLRVQWIHDIPGLMDYYLLCADRRLGTLNSSREGMTRQLKALQEKAQQEKELRESLSIASVPPLAALYKKKNIRSSLEHRLDGSIPTKEEASSHGGSGVIMGVKSFIGKSKGGSKNEPKKVAEPPDHLEDMLHRESPPSLIASSDESDHRVFWADDVVAASLTRSHTLINDYPVSEASTTSSIILATHIANSSKNTPRWQMRRHCPGKTTGGFAHPSYPSWNISRAFINRKKTVNRERSNNTSPVHLKEKGGDAMLAEVLKLPPSAPRLIVEREKIYALALISSRESFSKAARRSLNSIFNPGGVLTIRPMTALNLPNTFTGMFVKLRYDDIVQSTVSVDSKVVPVWSNNNDFHRGSSTTMKNRLKCQIQRRGNISEDAVRDFDDVAEIFNPTRAGGTRQCDINIQISPFETSKSLRLSVIGESRGPNVEIGVLDIPLGAALECTMDQPAYTRWFPLKSPAEAVPIEGDMNRSCRPFESEKINDSMFSDYFAPCIKLALMFQPNSIETDDDYVATADQYLYVRVDQISAALIDSSRTRELVSFSASDVDVRYSVTSAKTRLAVAVGHIQLDQQCFGTNAQVPVLLSPTPTKFPQPTVQFLAWKDNIRSKLDMDSYEYVAIQLQEMDLKIEEALLYDVWKFYLDIAKTREARASCWRHNSSRANFSADAFDVGQGIDPIEIARLFLTQDKRTKRRKIYVKELILGFFKVNLSYFKSSRLSRGGLDSHDEMPAHVESLELLAVRTPSSNEQQGRPSSAADDAYLQWSENFDSFEERIPFASMISAVFPRISDAPIRFNERIIYHVYESEGDIWKSLRSFYSSESLKQIYKIVGSLDFVGNPTMVLTSFRTGLRDFVLQPSRELKHITKNPSRVGVGVLKGTLSLVSNSASGIFGFASNLGATVGHTATQLTLDEDFQRLHSEQKAAQRLHYDRSKTKGFAHFGLMVSRPVSDIVFGVISASTGILLEPYRGAKQGGFVGFTKGTAIGIIGVVVKPVVGFSDAFAHVTESIHDLAKSVNLLELKSKSIERFRLPNVFGPQRMLLPFNAVDAKSVQLLLAHPLEKKAKKLEEVIVASEALHRGNGLEHYVVVTQLRVVLFKLRIVDGQGFVTANLVWQVKLLDTVARVTSSMGSRGHNGYVLCISRSILRKQEYDTFGDPSQHDSYHRGSLHTINKDEHNQSESFVFNRDERNSNPGTPKSLYPLGSSTVRLGNVRSISTAEGADVYRFVVEGDLNHRSQLSRIHNAICCIVEDFDAIKREKYDDGNEGVTSFGPYIFEPKIVQNREDQSPSLYSPTEDTVWKFEPSLTFSSPSWVVGSGMAESPSYLQLQSSPDADTSYDVSDPHMISLLEDSVRKYDVVSDKNFFLHSQIDSDSIGIESGESDDYAEEQSEREQDSFVESFEPFPFLTMPNPAKCKVDDEVVSASLFSEKGIKSDLVERVRRVEAMMERLVGQELTNDVSIARASSQRAPNDIHLLDELGGFSDFDAGPISPLSHDNHVDVHALLKEIDDLKQQLAEKNATNK